MPLEDVAWALEDFAARRADIRARLNYRDGRHRTLIPQGKTLSQTLRDLIDELNDNLCDDVVEEPTSRIRLTTWTAQSKDVAILANELWDDAKADPRLRDLCRNAFTTGDGWAIAQLDRLGRPRWYSQPPELMAARYDDDSPDDLAVAAKMWRNGNTWRMNLYYPPEAPGRAPWVERYTAAKTSGSEAPGFKRWSQADLPDQEAVEELAGSRIPVFHFPHDNVGGYGRPALTGTVMGLQDVLNKSVGDMVVAMEAHALPDRWGTGIQAERDPVTGEERPIQRTGRERLIRTGSKDAQFGQFPQASMDSFLETQKELRLEMARKGHIPPYLVSGGGDTPSGLALILSDGRVVKRVKAAETDWTPELCALQAYLLELAGTPVEPSELEPQWAPPETRDDQALLEGLVIKVDSLGLPKREALVEAGYDEDDVDEWLEDARAQAEAISGGRLSSAGASGGMLPPGQPLGIPGAPMAPLGAAQPTP